MKALKLQLTFLLILASVTIGLGQEVNFTTSVSAKKAGVKDRFQVTYSCNKQGKFIAPKFKHFTQVGGISQGSSSNVTFDNGKVTQEVTYIYQLILQPKQIGVFKVEGAKIVVGSATYESKPVQVEVVKESQARQRRQQRSIFDQMDDMMRGFPQQRRAPVEITDKDFFSKISVSKSNPVKNEHLLVTYKIYAKRFNFGLESYDFPTQENFWSESIKIPENVKPTNETIDGIQYQVYTLKKELLYPQKSGKLKLNPFEVTARIQSSPFSPAVSKTTKSNAPVIEVNSLPANAPTSFTNQVGRYEMKVSLAKDSVLINEPIDYKITVSGKGNLKQLNEFELTFPEGIEVYDPELKNKISVSEGGVKGSKTFNYLLIPRQSGTFRIPKVTFTYYDLTTKQYKTITSSSYEVEVYNEDGTQDETSIDEENKEEKEEEVSSVQGGFNLWFVLIPLLLLVAGGLFYFLVIKKNKKEETEEERRKNARKKLASKLQVAKSHLDNQEISSFYDEILIGLNKYVNEKLQLETAQMTKESIGSRLGQHGVGESTVSSFISVLEQCEMAKYAPLTSQNNHHIYEQSIDVIEEIEQQIG